ncbi:unnamed protein product [Lepeophtheirus salmonis]|uniref:(salmon louse) hypothetical protein n=1 Tax=Lepeophtheirus salmonis TaxID=72036 RepID=A0A7R8CNQ9_LEPSM|nr:unnamed protein product [Lepeophtheirus salmonis]CAF2876852.1 unnamed protein product [Lepeophtheirus salmonis]
MAYLTPSYGVKSTLAINAWSLLLLHNFSECTIYSVILLALAPYESPLEDMIFEISRLCYVTPSSVIGPTIERPFLFHSKKLLWNTEKGKNFLLLSHRTDPIAVKGRRNQPKTGPGNPKPKFTFGGEGAQLPWEDPARHYFYDPRSKCPSPWFTKTVKISFKSKLTLRAHSWIYHSVPTLSGQKNNNRNLILNEYHN